MLAPQQRPPEPPGSRAGQGRARFAFALVAAGLMAWLGNSCALWRGKRTKDQPAATTAPEARGASGGGPAAGGGPGGRFVTSATVNDSAAGAPTPSPGRELLDHALGGANAGPDAPHVSSGGGVPSAAAERRVGIVRVIGARGKFVLIETNTGYAGVSLAEGQELRCRGPAAGGGAQTAVLKVSRERQAPFLVADVVSGEPRAGDVAYFAAPPEEMKSGARR
jgi:hypothetical protein